MPSNQENLLKAAHFWCKCVRNPRAKGPDSTDLRLKVELQRAWQWTHPTQHCAARLAKFGTWITTLGHFRNLFRFWAHCAVGRIAPQPGDLKS